MKKIPFILLSISIFFFSSCNKDKFFAPFAVPVIKSLQDIRQSVKVEAAKETNADGKIYVTSKYLFYIAKESGVHIFDNQNPAQPLNKLFLNIEGVHDIAVKGNYLYADNYVDLLVFDISDMNAVHLIKTVENSVEFFPEYPKSIEYSANDKYPSADEIITGYTTEMRKRPRPRRGGIFTQYEDVAMPTTTNSSGGATGTGGSYAKFQINRNALYITESNNLKVFNISNPIQTIFDKPVYLNQWMGGGQFETLFKQGDYLFIGSTNGMYVVDASDEFNPQFLSAFSHATSCDPVVVDGTTAYITLRGGTTCNASIPDQINVIDITDMAHPSLVSTYLMNQPMGLGVRNNAIYVCSGNGGGLNVFDASNHTALSLKNTYTDDVTDVIALDSHLIAVGKNKIIQYSYGDNFTLLPISTVNF
jgi:hypothetical protein